MREIKASRITAIGLCLLFGAAQSYARPPLRLQKGSEIEIVFGPGSSTPAGTRLKGVVTYENNAGIGFKTSQGHYFVHWEHIRSIKPHFKTDLKLIMGSGTSIPEGTKLSGTLTQYNDIGVGLITPNGGRYWIHWDHARQINGVDISKPAPQTQTQTQRAPDSNPPVTQESANPVSASPSNTEQRQIAPPSPPDDSEIRSEPAVENPAILAVNNSVSLAHLLSNLYYIEPSDSNQIAPGQPGYGVAYADYEKGNLNGGSLAFSWMSPADRDLYVHAEWNGVSGQTDYTGFLLSGSPLDGPSGATIQDYDVKIGKGFAASNIWMLTPYFTLGGRHWTRGVQAGTAGAFNETYQHFYFGFGNLLQYAPSAKWVLTGDAMVGKTFLATMTSSPPNSPALGDSPVIKIGLDSDYRVNSILHFFTGLDYMWFSYGQSGIGVSGSSIEMEPISRTQVWNWTTGIRLTY